ncbi:ABC transporter ATP-binding protein [Pseudoduganella sp. R-43]|uniref:ABC transporter ATP-binding protein n=1 Tax=unclassified Pseudoduganella TaxID=2637179 RepID=UPI003CEB1B7F
MSSDIAIKVENLSKCFQIYDKPRDRLLQMLVRNRKQYFREFWAVRDVSFEIKRGETVGIVGRNGSGKSTLLQIICGTLNPTRGSVQTSGRIAALLELGSGFNPEFTGRENVYMNAAVLGLTRAEIEARFDDILAFADIGEFIEQPVKTYSSGMMVRLAFAVAINVDPEILIVDEALSVGDELFQRKCFSRIEAIRAKGATILFVSHAGSTVVELCDQAILMDAGEKLAVGKPKQIVGRYQKLLYAPADKQAAIREQIRQADLLLEASASHVADPVPGPAAAAAFDDREEESFDPSLKPSSTIAYEMRGAEICEPKIVTIGGRQVNHLRRGRTYRYVYTARFDSDARNVRFGMLIKTLSGVELGGSVSANGVFDRIPFIAAGTEFKVEFRFNCSLNPGVYFLNAGLQGEVDGVETYLHRLIDIAMFRVAPEVDDLATGTIDFACSPDVEPMNRAN